MVRRTLTAIKPYAAQQVLRFSTQIAVKAPTPRVIFIQGNSPWQSGGFTHFMRKALEQNGAAVTLIGDVYEELNLDIIKEKLPEIPVGDPVTVLLSAHGAWNAELHNRQRVYNFKRDHGMSMTHFLFPYSAIHYIRLDQTVLTPTSEVLALCVQKIGPQTGFLLLTDDAAMAIKNNEGIKVAMQPEELIKALQNLKPANFTPAGLLDCHAQYIKSKAKQTPRC